MCFLPTYLFVVVAVILVLCYHSCSFASARALVPSIVLVAVFAMFVLVPELYLLFLTEILVLAIVLVIVLGSRFLLSLSFLLLFLAEFLLSLSFLLLFLQGLCLAGTCCDCSTETSVSPSRPEMSRRRRGKCVVTPSG